MAEQSIGELIRRHMKQKSMSATALANKINIERQSLYDIFNSTHISTSRLVSFCKVLEHDFFADLSNIYCNTNNQLVDKADDGDGFSLIDKDRLPAVNSPFMRSRIVEKFIKKGKKKLLVIFYDFFNIEDFSETGPIAAVCDACDLTIEEDAHLLTQSYETPALIASDKKVQVYCYNGSAYSRVLQEFTQPDKKDKKKKILMIPVMNELQKGVNGGVEYQGIADDLYAIWRDKASFSLFAFNYGRRRELYRAYLCDGIFDRMSREYMIDDNIERQLVDLVVGEGALDVVNVTPPDNNDTITISLAYPPATKEELDVLKNNGVNDNPKLTMWFNIRQNILIDFEYRRAR